MIRFKRVCHSDTVHPIAAPSDGFRTNSLENGKPTFFFFFFVAHETKKRSFSDGTLFVSPPPYTSVPFRRGGRRPTADLVTSAREHDVTTTDAFRPTVERPRRRDADGVYARTTFSRVNVGNQISTFNVADGRQNDVCACAYRASRRNVTDDDASRPTVHRLLSESGRGDRSIGATNRLAV